MDHSLHSTPYSSPVNAKRIPNDVWERYKKEILSLYETNGVDKVTRLMKERYNFDATVKQFLYRITEKWKIRKYAPKVPQEETLPHHQSGRPAYKSPARVSKSRPTGVTRPFTGDVGESSRRYRRSAGGSKQPSNDVTLPPVQNHNEMTSEVTILDTGFVNGLEMGSRDGDFPHDFPMTNTAKPERLSCPFRKRNPLRFNVRNYQSCATQPYPDISQLKRHIKIFHQRSHIERCPRCKAGFETKQDVEYHLLVPSDQICDLNTLPPIDPEDGITEAIEDALNERRSDAKIDSWDALWRLLFPGDSEPGPSNFQTVREHHELERYIVSRIPDVAASVVNNVAVFTAGAIQACLEDSLDLVIRSFQEVEDGKNAAQHATSQPEESASPSD